MEGNTVLRSRIKPEVLFLQSSLPQKS